MDFEDLQQGDSASDREFDGDSVEIDCGYESSSRNKPKRNGMAKVNSDDEDEDEETSKSQQVKLKRKKKDGPIAGNNKKHKSARDLYKPPTVEEINFLKENENIHHSNLFRLQSVELLKADNVTEENKLCIPNFVDLLNRKIMKLKPKTISYDFKRDIQLPIDISSHNVENITLNFVAPQEPVYEIGAINFDTCIEDNVDLCLIMPSEIFHKDDYLDSRYYYKKILYIYFIAAKLRNKFPSIQYNYFKNDCMNPMLEFDLGTVRFYLHFVCEKKQFPLQRFFPSMNNVKGRVLKTTEENKNLEIPPTPTPNYNYLMLMDLTMIRNNIILNEKFKINDSIRDAIVLLKIWLKERALDQGYYGFNGFIVTMYMAYLLREKKIYATMSSYQILRLFWNNLGQSNWDKTGISLSLYSPDEKEYPPPAAMDEFLKYFEVVFIDYTGHTNICSNMSLELYQRVKDECKYAIECLDDPDVNSFKILFMTKVTPLLSYDNLLCINHWDIFDTVVNEYGSNEDKLNFHKNVIPHFRKMLMSVIRKGLKGRCLSITPITANIKSWELCTTPNNDYLQFAIGLKLSPDEAMDVVIKGPQSNEAEAKEFREFWGDKATLRRFQDGSITESCVWGSSEDPIGEKRAICEKIIKHLLLRHFDITSAFINYFSNVFETIIRSSTNTKIETIEEKSLACIRTFDSLSKEMKEIENLPLEITAVLGVDPIFRYCEVAPPLPKAFKTRLEDKTLFSTTKVINGIITLSASGKWPDDLEMIRRLKTAFYQQIAKQLHSKCPNMVTYVYVDHFDVLADKFLYRFKIVHPKEIFLNQMVISNKNNLTKEYKDNEKSLKIELESLILPKLSSFLHGLHQKHSSFGPAVAITKRWLNTQLMSDYFWPDICTELVMASLYLQKYPYKPPFSPQAAFFRFLHLISTIDWNSEMIIVNFNNEISSDKLEELKKRFELKRQTFPPFSIVSSCDYEKLGLWTKKVPTELTLRRIKTLCKTALYSTEKNLFKINLMTIKNLCTPGLKGFDYSLRINEKILIDYNLVHIESLQSHDFSKAVSEKEQPYADFNLIDLYLRDLREAYGNVAFFFNDPFDTRMICVVFKPDAIETRSLETNGTMGEEMKNSLKWNRDAMVEDFQIIGKGIVDKVVSLK